MRRVAFAVALVACHAQEAEPTPTVSLPTASAAPPVATALARCRSMPRPVLLAEVSAPIDALAASGSTVFLASRDAGTIFAIDVEDPAPHARVVASGEHEPTPIVVREGRPVWAAIDGLFAGSPRTPLAKGAVSALATTEDGLVFADADAIRRMSWPRETKATTLVASETADEIVTGGGWIVWRSGRRVYRLDLATGAKATLHSGRKPHDLSTDGRFVFFHEGEADLLAGRDPVAFLYDSRGWSSTSPPGEWQSSRAYAVDGSRVFASRGCERLDQSDWQRFDVEDASSSPAGPVALDRGRFYWTEMVCTDAGCGASSRIYGIDTTACRE